MRGPGERENERVLLSARCGLALLVRDDPDLSIVPGTVKRAYMAILFPELGRAGMSLRDQKRFRRVLALKEDRLRALPFETGDDETVMVHKSPLMLNGASHASPAVPLRR